MFNFLSKQHKEEKSKEAQKPSVSVLSTDISNFSDMSDTEILNRAMERTFQKDPILYHAKPGQTMDSCCPGGEQALYGAWGNISPGQIDWYGSQGFIGYQLCAILSQNWLIRKCCSMPAKDATRKGYDVTNNNGDEIAPEILDAIRQADKKYKLTKNMLEFVTKGKIFGVRVCIFQVKSKDPLYYEKPFNINSVKEGTYLGMTQVDPYWIYGQPDMESTSNPASQNFYEPTWWIVNGKKYHHSHMVIYREDDDQLPDTLKPTYYYGGISVPQKIAERVYAAERTANEAPLLALTKRLRVYKTDLSQATANGAIFWQKIKNWVTFSNNFGVQVIGDSDEINQFDVALSDLDAIIMTQYQLVAAAAEIPAVKLLGTSPKGFNTTGEYEESSYHEMLESIQSHHLTPLIERHHQLLIRSEIAPKFGAVFETTITWKPLDAMTAKEEAEVNNIKADTDSKLSAIGAIDGQDGRNRIVADPNSGYSGISTGAPEPEVEETEEGENETNS
jgi:phage-related protein (TIGR01555 family)